MKSGLTKRAGREMPAVVFVTAYDEYAIRAFDAHAIDYLLKPFSDERFEAALDRAIRHLRAGHAQALLAQMQALLGPWPAAARSGDRCRASTAVRCAPARARSHRAEGDRPRPPAAGAADHLDRGGRDVRQAAPARRHGASASQPARDLDAALDKRRFVRVHRSAIVNIDVIDELQQDAARRLHRRPEGSHRGPPRAALSRRGCRNGSGRICSVASAAAVRCRQPAFIDAYRRPSHCQPALRGERR